MKIYLDTSLIVAALVAESRSAEIVHWLGERDESSLAISDWSLTEVASALAMKRRTLAISAAEFASIQATWTILRERSLTMLPVDRKSFVAAADFINRVPGLRSGDALHLAVAAANGCAIATLDKVQADAAPLCGVPVEIA